MTFSLFCAQLLNGFQLGVLLFLLSAGLTLVLGIMQFINLAHGSLFMMGAYFAVTAYDFTNSFVFAALAAVIGTLILGSVLERVLLAKLYARDHLYQVLATFGLILVLNEVGTHHLGSIADLPQRARCPLRHDQSVRARISVLSLRHHRRRPARRRQFCTSSFTKPAWAC